MFKDENRHYSLRKLSVGLASVLIGISFVSGNGHTVKADTVKDDSNGVQTVIQTTVDDSDAVVKDHDATAEANAKDDANTVTKANTESTLKEQSQTPEAVKKNSDIITQDSKQKTVKASEAAINVQNNTVKDNSDETTLNAKGSKAATESMPKEGKIEVKENQGWTDPVKNKLQMSTVRSTTSKRLNAKLLAVSKVVSQANDTNGGFDSSWGKLDINDWKGSVQGDYYQLIDYTGDANHIIVPNEADFVKAGISTSGKQVGVTSDLMHTIFRDKTAAQDATVAFSKTDNKQVKAIGNDWYDTWGHAIEYVNGSWIQPNGKLTKFDGSNLDVANVTDMSNMFDDNQISNLSPLANWKTDNVTDMRSMFDDNNISDLSPLANWKTDNVTDMSNMLSNNHISDLRSLANWKTDNVTDMRYMFNNNNISDLSSLSNWKVDKVANMCGMFDSNQISNLSPLSNWKVDNVTNMSWMFSTNRISDLSPLANWETDNVINMSWMFYGNQISNLSLLANWKTDNVIDMNGMFDDNNISDLSPLANWKTDNVTNMSSMFYGNRISNISPLANWKVDKVTNISGMFNDNVTTQTKNLQAKRVINFVYPDGYTGKKQDSITQTVDVPQKVDVRLITKDSKPSNNILDWVTKTETPENPDPVYFQDYTVPEIKGLLEPDQTVISKQQADITKPINVTVTYKLVDSNTNDAFALDSKNGLHEHINVNDNGGYDADYWGKLDINDWDYTTNGNTITIKGYKGNDSSSLIIPNGADFDFSYGQNNRNSRVEISSSVMHNLAKNATRIGLSKTANNKVAASDAIWQDAFGGMTNKPGTTRNANGGIKYGSPNLTQMDLHNLDTATITNMSSLFNGGSNLTTVGDLSDWNTSNVTTMRAMFQEASGLTNIGDLDNWNTNNVTDMSYMFRNTTSLTNIGNLSKWQTSNVTDMSDMFSNATNLTNIGNLGNWDTNKVTNMSWMFGTGSRKQSHLTNIGNLSKWQTGNVTDMHDMFANATKLTNIGDLDNWDTSKVTDTNWMFGGTTNLTNIGDLSKWQTGNVTNMSSMFYNATKLTNIGNLDNWDTSKVTDMRWMFANTTKLTNIGNLDNWDTSKVTDMSDMFINATSLTNIGNLSKWQTGNVTDMHAMFANATNLTNIGNLDNWDTSKVTDMSWMFGTDSNKQSHLTNIGDLDNWDTSKVTDMHNMFANATNLTNIGDLDNWDTSKVTDMSWMFGTDSGKQSHLTNIGDLSKWQTGNVTDMNNMFTNATNLTNIGDLDNWDTSKVTDMSWMFGGTTSLTNIGNLSKWQTGNVTDMSDMFINATNLTNIGNLSKWQTGDVTDMHAMFANATNLTNIGNLDNWDTSKVTNMSWMFGTDSSKQSHLTNIGDLSKWQTGNVTNMSNIFYNIKALRHLNISNWNLTKLANKDSMKHIFDEDTDLTVIANDVKLPTWYQTEITDAKDVWDNHMAVITNVSELIKSAGAINNLKIDDQNTSRSIFYDSKGSSDAIQVLKDANQAYINKYEQNHPKYLLALDASVDQTDPIALANAKFKTSHKIIDVVQTNNATRTIIVHLPNGTTQTIVQTIGLKRNAQKDLVTEIISSTAPWELDKTNSSYTIDGVKQAQTAYKPNSNIITFSSIKLPKVPGYKAKVIRNNGLLMVSYLGIAGN